METMELWDRIKESYRKVLHPRSDDFVQYMSSIEDEYFRYLNCCQKRDVDTERQMFFEKSFALSEQVRVLSAKFEPRGNLHGQYERYRRTTRVSCCVMVDDSRKFFLVSQGFGDLPWTPPGGKLKSEMEDHYCYAQREVLEETGFTLPGPRELLYEEGRVSTYLQLGVPLNYGFQPQVPHEIERIAWASIRHLLSGKLKEKKFRIVQKVARRLAVRIGIQASDFDNTEELLFKTRKFEPDGSMVE